MFVSAIRKVRTTEMSHEENGKTNREQWGKKVTNYTLVTYRQEQLAASRNIRVRKDPRTLKLKCVEPGVVVESRDTWAGKTGITPNLEFEGRFLFQGEQAHPKNFQGVPEYSRLIKNSQKNQKKSYDSEPHCGRSDRPPTANRDRKMSTTLPPA